MFSFCQGRRSCIGKPLARMENFLLFANLMHSFRLVPASRVPHVDEVAGGLLVCPKDFSVSFHKRLG